jgi:hypothetical protein
MVTFVVKKRESTFESICLWSSKARFSQKNLRVSRIEPDSGKRSGE